MIVHKSMLYPMLTLAAKYIRLNRRYQNFISLSNAKFARFSHIYVNSCITLSCVRNLYLNLV